VGGPLCEVGGLAVHQVSSSNMPHRVSDV